MTNHCERFILLCHNDFARADEAECTCPVRKGCNYVNPRACTRCGWVNTWNDSGDRGAAQADHDYSCK